MTTQWEDIDVPRGAYISWAPKPGQTVTGKVLDYTTNGGTDFNGNPCPQVSMELREDTYSINKHGERFDHPAGDLIVINAGVASLKRAVLAANPTAGDLLKISYSGTYKTKEGEGKEFDIKIARGAGGSSAPAAPTPAAPAPAVTAPTTGPVNPTTGLPYTPEQVAALQAAGLPIPGL